MVPPRVRRSAMAATVIGLVAVIAFTPSLRERPGPTIQSAPLVLLDLMPTVVLVSVHGAFDQVRYARVTVALTDLTNLSLGFLRSESDTYGFEVRVARSPRFAFDVNVTVYDSMGHGFRWRGSVLLDRDSGGEFMAVTNIGDLRLTKVYPPATFRTLIPELASR